MTVKKEVLPALICCLFLLSTCVQATEELSMAWMKISSLPEVKVAATVGDAQGCSLVAYEISGAFNQDYPHLCQKDAYLIKYDPAGELIWVVPLATEGLDSVACVTVNEQGDCYVGGHTDGLLDPNRVTASEDTQADAFVAKISSEGSCVWIRQFGSALPDGARRIRLDRDGNCYVAGTTTGCIDGST